VPRSRNLPNGLLASRSAIRACEFQWNNETGATRINSFNSFDGRFPPPKTAAVICARPIYRRPFAARWPYRIHDQHRGCIVPGVTQSCARSRLSLYYCAWSRNTQLTIGRHRSMRPSLQVVRRSPRRNSRERPEDVHAERYPCQ
jgi:hypothetical protein